MKGQIIMRNSDEINPVRLSIIIVNYNAEKLLLDCVKSIYNSNNSTSLEVIIVDNDSKDNSRSLITSEYPHVQWVQNKDNVGFAKANNQAMKISKGEYIMLLNNDTVVLDKALDKLVQFLDKNPETAAVGPRILNADMSLQLSCRRGLPNAVNSFGYFLKLYKVLPNNKALGGYAMTYISDKISHEVECLSGAAMVVRKSVVDKIGGLDENFFMHFEDVDFCLRIGKLGYKLFYVHDSEIIHLKGQSSKLRSKKVIEDFNNSLLYYYKKNYSKEKSSITNGLVYATIWARKILSLAVYNMKNPSK
ncbi:MAG: glycosyl transferase family 2 [Clostridiaceae bacterium]|jgi:GT2 family glycosyltransferase|nr:glycosyl transferase family 2 [Clostridiaceae bacterium]